MHKFSPIYCPLILASLSSRPIIRILTVPHKRNKIFFCKQNVRCSYHYHNLVKKPPPVIIILFFICPVKIIFIAPYHTVRAQSRIHIVCKKRKKTRFEFENERKKLLRFTRILTSVDVKLISEIL